MSNVRKKVKVKRNQHKLFHRPPPGSMPGTVMVPADPNPTRIIATVYDEESAETAPVHEVKGRRKSLKAGAVTWIHVMGMQDLKSLQELCSEFGIHKLTIEDIISQYQRPKVEYFDTYTYIVVHIPRPDAESEVMNIVMGDTWVLTLQDSPIDYLEPIRGRIMKKIGQIRSKPRTYLAYAVIDAAIDLYFPLTENYAQRIESTETAILSGLKPVAVLDIFALRTKVNSFHRILWSHNQMISQLMHDPESPFDEECSVYLRDCFDHTIQILEFLETLKENSKTLIDLHLSLQGHRSNEIMKVLTIITAIFIPMSFISGVYGMNFNTASPHNMPELNWRYGYPMALALMVFAGGSMVMYFWRAGWFRTQDLPRYDPEEPGPTPNQTPPTALNPTEA